MHRAPKRAGGLRHPLAFGITILIHVALGAALLLLKQPVIRPLVEPVLYLAPPEPPRPPPPPPEPVKPEIKPPEPVTPQLTEAPKPIETPRKPAPAAAAPPAARPPASDGPPVHYFGGPGAGAGVATSGLGSVGDGMSRHAPSDYAEKVKARILANKVFPMEAQLKRQECVVTYSVTVDKAGQMIAHHIDPCPYPLVNQAAEQAILKSGPYEPPENGADTRIVYGTLPFHLEIQLPPVHPSR
jgi:periplasmic protein TonB